MEEKQGVAGRFVLTQPVPEADREVRSLLHTVRTVFMQRECWVYWRYPLFLPTGGGRKAPDVLILDRELGIVVLELVQANGSTVDPGSAEERAQRYLSTLRRYCDRQPLLQSVPGRSLAVRSSQLFPATLFQRIAAVPCPTATPLTEEQWKMLRMVISGAPLFQANGGESSCESAGVLSGRRAVVAAVRSQLHTWDEQQESLGKQIPPGVQRIRGIAGSGKTVLLCQKAAHLHLAHPDWEIALVFFTRSLYDQMEAWVDRWLRYFSGGSVSYDDTVRRNLHILHAWGGQKPGFYQQLAEAQGVAPLRASDTPHPQPSRGLAYACDRLLRQGPIPPRFDAVLIDEAQDLVVDEELKCGLEGDRQQPFFWLAYQSCRPVDPQQPEQRRLIWAYDEAQSLDTLKIPTARELFGDRLSQLLMGKHPGGIPKSIILRRCYRTPAAILTTAHAVGMGLLRSAGTIAGPTTRADWEALGYSVTGSFQPPGQRITLHRPAQHSPNPTPILWRQPVIEFRSYDSRQGELESLVFQLQRNLSEDRLQPDREVLVLVLGTGGEAIALEKQVGHALMAAGIDVYVASATALNQFPQYPQQNPDQFWHPHGVTLSRINRAKGNEAYMVHVVGVDQIARAEANPLLRNQLFVAITRSQGWLSLSGIGEFSLYEELRQAITQLTHSNGTETTLEFQFQRPSAATESP